MGLLQAQAWGLTPVLYTVVGIPLTRAQCAQPVPCAVTGRFGSEITNRLNTFSRFVGEIDLYIPCSLSFFWQMRELRRMLGGRMRGMQVLQGYAQERGTWAHSAGESSVGRRRAVGGSSVPEYTCVVRVAINLVICLSRACSID